jgi:DNA-binding NarL/FixJ family response regulator
VASGAAIFCPTLAERVLTFFSTSSTVASPRPFSTLTDREYEIFDLIARGESNTVIAKRLVLSPKTIRNHISNIFAKLQIADRSQAIVLARRAGLGLDGGP